MTTLNRNQTVKDLFHRYGDFYKIAAGIALVLVGIWIGSLIFAEGYATNVFTEALSVFSTILVLDRLNDWRAKQAYKQSLIRQLGSRIYSSTIPAVKELRANGWLKDGSLRGADLRNANLRGAYLYDTDLRGANLALADLEGAILDNTIFDEETVLPDATNTGTPRNAIYDKYWTSETDMERYTNPNRLDFWRSKDPRSPAFQHNKNEHKTDVQMNN